MSPVSHSCAWINGLMRRQVLRALIMATVTSFGGCFMERTDQESYTSGRVHVAILDLVAASSEKHTLMTHPVPEHLSVNRSNTETVTRFIMKHPDYRSYHLLFFMKHYAPRRYQALDPEIKARVLCSTLQSQSSFNDWGTLGPGSMSGDNMVAKEIVSLGCVALPFLVRTLDDKSNAFHYGSEASHQSRMYGLRRCDYAYRYIMQILGRPMAFQRHIDDRDELIRKIKTELEAM